MGVFKSISNVESEEYVLELSDDPFECRDGELQFFHRLKDGMPYTIEDAIDDFEHFNGFLIVYNRNDLLELHQFLGEFLNLTPEG